VRAETNRDDDELAAWLSLIRAPGVGARRIRELLEKTGSACDLLENLRRHPARHELADTARTALLHPDVAQITADRAWLDRPDHHLLIWTDADYPSLLRDTPRPPMALFVRGDPSLLWQPQIAMVGSRNPTAEGRANAHAFARALAQQGFTITSGLAGGIDSAAHEGALAGSGKTLAVVGAGADVVYPASNAALTAEIAGNGAIVSEFPPGTPPRPGHFPQRNRIIAGLALGTLVVEAATRSGSLITARLASEAGREVFALPGSIHNPMARGCHRLIRDGAKLVETADEIIEELRPLALQLGERLRGMLGQSTEHHETTNTGQPAGDVSRMADPDYRRLWAALGHDPVPVDTLVTRSGLTAPAISSMLLLMELDGLVTVGANGRYGRAVRKAE
jgi:DNA processing protein